MKKTLITFLLIAGLSTGLMAQNNTNTGNASGKCKTSSAYVDANKNKVCDNYENRTTLNGRGQGNGRRAGYGQGRCQGNCSNRTPGSCRRRS